MVSSVQNGELERGAAEFKGSASFVGSVNPQRCVKFVPDFLSVAFVRRAAAYRIN